MALLTCAYCGRRSRERPVPESSDDAGWAALARYHERDCEWWTTRAHRLDRPPGRPPRKPGTIADRRVVARVTYAELADVMARAGREGLSQSAYVRRALGLE